MAQPRRVPDGTTAGTFVRAYVWERTEYRRVSDAAWRLHSEARMWSAEALSDGVVTADDLTRLSYVDDPKSTAAELVDAGVWVELANDGTWDIDPRRQQRSAADIAHDRERSRRNTAEWRARRNAAAAESDELADELRRQS